MTQPHIHRKGPRSQHSPRFFTGPHQPSDAKHFDAAFVSVVRVLGRAAA